MSNVAQAGNLIEDKRLGKLHRRITIFAGGGKFIEGYDLGVIGAALPGLIKLWHLSPIMVAFTGSTVLIGNMVGMYVFGHLTDRIGRKLMFRLTMCGFVVFALLAGTAGSVWELNLWRFLIGMVIGADYVISSTLVSEFNPAAERGRRIGFMVMWIFVGQAMSYVIGTLMQPTGDMAWRITLGFGAVIAVVLFILRRGVPESPRWLDSRGRIDEARQVLQHAGMAAATPSVTAHSASLEPGKSTLWRGRNLRNLLFMSGILLCWDVFNFGVLIFAPTIVNAAGQYGEVVGLLGACFISLTATVSCIVASLFFYDRIGRRKCLLIGFAGITVFLLCLGLMHTPGVLTVTLLIAGAQFCGIIGPGVLCVTYPAELFPTHLRASGTGVVFAIGRIGALIGTLAFPPLIASVGVSAASTLFLVAGAIGLLVSWRFAPETANRTLEDIEETEGSPV